MSKRVSDSIDWRLTTWEGSTREQLRRWSQLPLEDIVRAQQEMQELSDRLGSGAKAPPARAFGHEGQGPTA